MRNSMHRKNRSRTTAALLLAVPLAVLAIETAETKSRPATTARSQLESSAARVSGSRFSRDQWDLTEIEWNRYLVLMQGVRGSISPNSLSPIEVLGVHARNEEERVKYARQWAEIMRDDTQRILAFQTAYNDAWRAMNPSGEIIDISRLASNRLPNSGINEAPVQAGDRVLLFLRLNKCPDCQSLYTRVRRAAYEANTQLDIYFTDTRPGKDDKALRQWIAKNRFDTGRVRQKKITFNHDNGVLSRTGGTTATAPAAYRIRNELIDPLQIGMPGL